MDISYTERKLLLMQYAALFYTLRVLHLTLHLHVTVPFVRVRISTEINLYTDADSSVQAAHSQCLSEA